MVDKDNRDVCDMSAVNPGPNCKLASALSSRMLPCCPGRAWLNRSYLAGTVVGWLVPIVRLKVRARARVELRYRLLSCPTSAAGSSNRGCSGQRATYTVHSKSKIVVPIRGNAQKHKKVIERQFFFIFFLIFPILFAEHILCNY